MADNNKTEAEVLEAVELISNSGAIQESLELGQKYVAKAKKYLSVIPKTSARTALEQLADFITVRKY